MFFDGAIAVASDNLTVLQNGVNYPQELNAALLLRFFSVGLSLIP